MREKGGEERERSSGGRGRNEGGRMNIKNKNKGQSTYKWVPATTHNYLRGDIQPPGSILTVCPGWVQVEWTA